MKPTIEYMTITPELARSWLDDKMFERQRGTRLSKIRSYAQMMMMGEWLPWTVIQFTRNGECEPVVTDGHHRLLAIESSGVPVEAIVITYQDNDIPSRYIVTDKGAPRSALDTIVALNLAETYGTNKSLINKVWSAVRVISMGFESGHNKEAKLESDVLNLITKGNYIEIAKVYSDLIGAKSYSGGFWRADTMAVGLYTLKYAHHFFEEEQVHEFWRGSARGTGEDPNDPRRMLHDHVMVDQIYSPKRLRGETVSRAYSVRYTAKCWNTWLAGTTFKRRQVSTSDKVVIEATPLGKEFKV
jgi:hypothetical protein